jgi:hypothetical protein
MEGLTGGSLSETAPLKPLPVRGDSSLSPAIEPRRMPIFNCSHIPMRSLIGIESKAVCSAQSFSGRNFIATKRGPANALHSGDPAYSALPAYFDKHLKPVLEVCWPPRLRQERCDPASGLATCFEPFQRCVKGLRRGDCLCKKDGRADCSRPAIWG